MTMVDTAGTVLESSVVADAVQLVAVRSVQISVAVQVWRGCFLHGTGDDDVSDNVVVVVMAGLFHRRTASTGSSTVIPFVHSSGT